MHLHVDTAATRAVAMEPAVRAGLERIRAAHAALPAPAEAGRHIGQARQ
jgi:hypothetical protein